MVPGEGFDLLWKEHADELGCLHGCSVVCLGGEEEGNSKMNVLFILRHRFI